MVHSAFYAEQLKTDQNSLLAYRKQTQNTCIWQFNVLHKLVCVCKNVFRLENGM